MTRLIFLSLLVSLCGCEPNGSGWSKLWATEPQQAQSLFDRGEFSAAAERFVDPLYRGVAAYRQGDFKAAAAAFARLDSAEGCFNHGNALVMQGKYEEAIARYERALFHRSDWSAALSNQSIARARQSVLDKSAQSRTEEGTEIGADEIRFDGKSDPQPDEAESVEVTEGKLTAEELRALWLRRVETKPADFLRSKFAYQLQRQVAEGEGK